MLENPAAATSMEARLSRPGLIALAVLLFLRLPFLVPAQMLRIQLSGQIYYIGTYWATLLLYWVERRRLRDYHIGPAAVAIVALAPTLEWLVTLVIDGARLPAPPRWLEIVPGLILIAALTLKGWPRPIEGRRVWAWAVGAVPVGLAAAAVLGLAGRLQQAQLGNRAVPVTWVLAALTFQLTRAATYEEPLFRGFLWGWLKERNWAESRIWLLQAGLFTLGHLYYFSAAPVSFWFVVPVSALLLGFFAWRSRSIVPSMVIHAIINAIGANISIGYWL